MINNSFLRNNREKLLQIYQKERFFNNNGLEGALMVDFRKKDNVDVYYWTIQNMNERFLK